MRAILPLDDFHYVSRPQAPTDTNVNHELEHGNVVEVRVVRGQPLLVDAALQAVGQWKYEPTTLNGQPVSVELEVQVHFNPKS